jgi:hypothetical protein
MSRAVFWWMPEDPHLPPEVHNQQAFIVGAIYTGPPSRGSRSCSRCGSWARRWSTWAPSCRFGCSRPPSTSCSPRGELASYWKSVYLNELTEDLTGVPDSLLDWPVRASVKAARLLWQALGSSRCSRRPVLVRV